MLVLALCFQRNGEVIRLQGQRNTAEWLVHEDLLTTVFSDYLWHEQKTSDSSDSLGLTAKFHYSLNISNMAQCFCFFVLSR